MLQSIRITIVYSLFLCISIQSLLAWPDKGNGSTNQYYQQSNKSAENSNQQQAIPICSTDVKEFLRSWFNCCCCPCYVGIVACDIVQKILNHNEIND